MAGFKDFVSLAVLTESDLDDYLAKQVVMKFATSAARATALATAAREGMLTYQDDTNCLVLQRDGTAANISTIGPVHGALTTYTPTLVQSGAVTKTVNNASYIRIGRMVIGNVWLNATGAGTASNVVTISTPFTASTASAVVGSGYWYDASLTTVYSGSCALLTTTTFAIYSGGSAAFVGLGATGSSFTGALASGDILNISFMYEVAADA